MERPDLPQRVSDAIDELLGEADELAASGDGADRAFAVLEQAWQLLPEPRAQWAVQPWMICQAAIELALDTGSTQQGRDWLPRLVESSTPASDFITAGYPAYAEGRLRLLDRDEAGAQRSFAESVRLSGLVNFSDDPRLLSWYREQQGHGPWQIPLVDPLADPDSAPEHLPEKVQEAFNPAAVEGNELAAEGRHEEAIRVWLRVLAQIPQPVQAWGAAEWLYSAIGNSMYQAGDLLGAELVLLQTESCVGGDQDAMAQLRLGQVALELGRPQEVVTEHLREALSLDPEVFEGEDPTLRELAR